MKLSSTIAAAAANVVFPGAGFFVKLWAGFKPLLPYLAIAAGVAALLLFVDHRGYRRGVDDKVAKYQPVIERALQREKLASASITRLRGAIARQNEATKGLHDQETAKLATAQQLLAIARSHDRARGAAIDRLRESATKPAPGAPCAPSYATKDLWQ